ncbi:hypothetical protein MASR2M64_03320 [Candidatus Cloacimonadota bacterium]
MKHNWLFWIPRGLLLLIALFTVLFSFDVFESAVPWYEVAMAFLIHNIPFFAIVIILYISWKSPAIASILCYLTMLGFAFIIRSNGKFYIPLIFESPIFIVGSLFLLEYFKAKSIKAE